MFPEVGNDAPRLRLTLSSNPAKVTQIDWCDSLQQLGYLQMWTRYDLVEQRVLWQRVGVPDPCVLPQHRASNLALFSRSSCLSQ